MPNPDVLASVGGLDDELKVIVRRIFATRRLAAGQASALGLSHVRGLLLHGPPGCGKTLMARQLAQALDAASCQVVSGPEVLNKFVGTSEERVRSLFAVAERDWKAKGQASGLHVIVLDELDAICKQVSERYVSSDLPHYAQPLLMQHLFRQYSHIWYCMCCCLLCSNTSNILTTCPHP